MKKNYWFMAKNYGWGWYPSSWQGWSVIALYVTINLFLFYNIDTTSFAAEDTIYTYAPYAIVLTIILVAICYATGEKPGWHWGRKKKTTANK